MNSSAIWAAISPAPTTPTLVTLRASARSGAPAGRLARFCTRSKAYSPARSSSGRSRWARAAQDPGGPAERLLEEVGGLEHRVGDAERVRLGPADHLVLVERVLDDER